MGVAGFEPAFMAPGSDNFKPWTNTRHPFPRLPRIAGATRAVPLSICAALKSEPAKPLGRMEPAGVEPASSRVGTPFGGSGRATVTLRSRLPAIYRTGAVTRLVNLGLI